MFARLIILLSVALLLAGCEGGALATGLLLPAQSPTPPAASGSVDMDPTVIPVEGVWDVVPVATTIAPMHARVGDEVTLTGTFYRPSKNLGFFVSFNGVDAKHPRLVDAHTVKAVVPQGGTSGQVVVTIGKYRSQGVWLDVAEPEHADD